MLLGTPQHGEVGRRLGSKGYSWKFNSQTAPSGFEPRSPARQSGVLPVRHSGDLGRHYGVAVARRTDLGATWFRIPTEQRDGDLFLPWHAWTNAWSARSPDGAPDRHGEECCRFHADPYEYVTGRCVIFRYRQRHRGERRWRVKGRRADLNEPDRNAGCIQGRTA